MKHCVVGLKNVDGKWNIILYYNGKTDLYEIDKNNLKSLNEPYKKLYSDFDKVSLSSDFFHPEEFPEIPKIVFEVFCGE
ncbi:MAG: hypothetical protein RBT49_08765 [Bacteroidales bacterium]|jgi:hypothetical protein|nr:hypothetical protein [Bacteroidales bacterium]